MDYILTSKHQHSQHCKDGKRKNFLLFFLNDILIFKQKRPFDEFKERGFDGRWHFKDIFLQNGTLYQTRYDERESRDVKFPVSKKILEQFEIPKDLIIKITKHEKKA